MRASILALAGLIWLALPVAAQGTLDSLLKGKICGPRVQVTFEDGFPDAFTIRNLSPAGWTLRALTIDLSNSFGKVVFDTEPGAAGIEQADTYYATSREGPMRLLGATPRADRRAMELRFAGFISGSRFAFKIDMDDTAPVSSRGRARVTFGEMWDTKVTAHMEGPAGYAVVLDAAFGQTGLADTGGGGCDAAHLR
jgi:hypothetical protein